jgi:hypothetical protein
MPKPKFPYAGDAALKRLLERYRCPAPFHVVACGSGARSSAHRSKNLRAIFFQSCSRLMRRGVFLLILHYGGSK